MSDLKQKPGEVDKPETLIVNFKEQFLNLEK